MQMIRKTLKVSFYYSFVPSVKLEGEVPAAPSEGHADQVHRSELLDDGEWTFRVEGTIIDGNKNAACQSTAKKFSHFFRKAILDLDDQLYPGSNPIEWSSFRSGDDSDGFSITRPGKKGFQTHRLRLQLLRNQSPERFALSPDLFNAISPYLTPNCGPDDTFVKADISFALWQYIKEKDLMKTDDCRVISHDEVLQRVFECHEQPIHAIMGSLQTKLTPVGPTVIDFTLQ
ncbi:hypothetical protein DYB30_010662 [Aphanomyces astaci]|uniref:DM2 domain-containing protein n=1 Tax=Aphanomyces astaci TaxID=112090 RepID=A0A397CF99_APHAT|nr:hypothetical protein DYB34_005526 [Aphanomyces astaci]RHY44760.1 hypothetical protein DYB30_010662 [Aphanomyces astaci]